MLQKLDGESIAELEQHWHKLMFVSPAEFKSNIHSSCGSVKSPSTPKGNIWLCSSLMLQHIHLHLSAFYLFFGALSQKTAAHCRWRLD